MVKPYKQIMDEEIQRRKIIRDREIEYIKNKHSRDKKLLVGCSLLMFVVWAAISFLFLGNILVYFTGIVTGFVSVKLICKLNVGILIGMFVNTIISMFFLILYFKLSMLSLEVIKDFGGIGHLMVLLFGIASWPVIGGIIGFINARNDENNLVI